MYGRALFVAMLVFSIAGAQDAPVDSLIAGNLMEFMAALQEGRGQDAAQMFSQSALSQVEAMLNTVKQSAGSDSEATVRRLQSAGYEIDEQGIRRWQVFDYLSQTLSLPMITARYLPYEMEVVSIEVSGRSASVELVFRTSTGTEIPQEALLSFENDSWRVSSFMGITAFP